MRPIKEQQQAHARNLYFQSDLTRAQLAQQVGVSEKTIYLWTKQGDWQRLRSGSRLMPSMLVEHFSAQVQELNEAIHHARRASVTQHRRKPRHSANLWSPQIG